MTSLRHWLASHGPCALVGIFTGAVSGFIFELLQLSVVGHTLPMRLIGWFGIGLALFSWLLVLLVFGALAGLGVRRVALRAFPTCLLTAVITVLIDHAAGLPVVSVLIGLIVGFTVGRALCTACNRFAKAEATNV